MDIKNARTFSRMVEVLSLHEKYRLFDETRAKGHNNFSRVSLLDSSCGFFRHRAFFFSVGKMTLEKYRYSNLFFSSSSGCA